MAQTGASSQEFGLRVERFLIFFRHYLGCR
jgi:hypothetical protein